MPSVQADHASCEVAMGATEGFVDVVELSGSMTCGCEDKERRITANEMTNQRDQTSCFVVALILFFIVKRPVGLFLQSQWKLDGLFHIICLTNAL